VLESDDLDLNKNVVSGYSACDMLSSPLLSTDVAVIVLAMALQ